MPTPFYHLSLAEDLLRYPTLAEPVRQFLFATRSEFLFGNTAPDVQVVSGQPRKVTHFFDLPIKAGDPPAREVMLEDYPALADARQIPEHWAGFVGGYLCHLQADWLWVKEIFAPVFGPTCTWGSFRERLYLHNILRAYLDVHILPELSADMDIRLSKVEPKNWLPFVKDDYLRMWRNLLFPQLKPGAITQTVEVFSSRQGISAPEFHAMLESDERMQMEIFNRLPIEQIQGYHARVLDENSRLITDYLAFTLHQIHLPVEGIVNPGAQI